MIRKMIYIKYIVLLPFTIIYGIIIWIRNRLFDFHILPTNEYSIPVISVGNITVGGTGKTPHVEYLIKLLKDEYKVAVLSRGYKRKTKGFFIATEKPTPAEIGDEPCQIKNKFPDIIVAVDGKRRRGISKLLDNFPNLNAIILDDAFQHRYVKPGISILLVDYNNPLKNDHLLPAGRLREQIAERKRADIIIVTKCPDNIKPIDFRLIEKDLKTSEYQRIFYSNVKILDPKPIFIANQKVPKIEEIIEMQPEIIAISGLANNDNFIKQIHTLTNNTIHIFRFPDHYDYSVKDLHEIIELFSELESNNKIILTTEKDAMKIQSFPNIDEDVKNAMYYLPIEVVFTENEKDIFNTYIKNYVHNNRPDSVLHNPNLKKK